MESKAITSFATATVLLLATIVQVQATLGSRYETQKYTSVEPTYSFGSNEAYIDWWSMFRHDLRHTGNSTSKAPNNNQILWTYATGGYVYSSPTVKDGKVYIGSLDKKVYALNASTGTVIWSYITGGYVYSSPAVDYGRVYIGSFDSKLYALNASTGTLLWSYTTGSSISYSSPALANGRVYVGSKDGKVYALNAFTGALVWSYTTGSWVESSPAVADGKVFIGSWDGKLYALNASTGALVWSFAASYMFSSPAIAYGKVYIGSWDYMVYALNASTGASIWSFTTGVPVYSSPAVADGKVYIGSLDNRVYALNASTGALVWSYATGGAVYSSPSVADGKVYIGSRDSKVYALNAYAGSLIWNYATGGAFDSSPGVADGKVYIGSYDNKIYAFGSHDVAITGVTPSLTKALVGQIVDVTVVAKNEGTETETFDVSAYYGSSLIGTLSVSNLGSDKTQILTFNWNTASVIPGNYTIKAIANTVQGEIDTADNTYIDGTVKIIKPPVAHFTYSPTVPFTGEIITFNASLSTPDGGTIISYEWNFGDGTPNATGIITTHAFADNGTYTVRLTVTDDDGLTGTYSQNITVLNRLPVASFTESVTTVYKGEVIYFNASSSYDPDGSVVGYFWNFGDGINAAGVLVNHSYISAGTYIVTLAVTDNDGATASTTAVKTVLSRPPFASFTELATTVYTGTVIYFNASSSYDPDGTIVSYFWTFGDRANATGVLVSHAYTNNGVYTVTLRVTDSDGVAGMATATKTILNRAPVASFTESATTVLTGGAIYFNASASYDPDGSIVSYFWDFGDGTNSTGVTSNHAYAENGTYVVTLTTTDDDGSIALAIATKTVLNRPPVASFTESATLVHTGEVIYFNASASHDPDGSIVSYFWDFGDGTNATGITVSHAYVDNGTYTVKLTVIDDDGVSTSISAMKTVRRPDIAITDVTSSKTVVGQGFSIWINVTVKNGGDYAETFNVTVYANTTSATSKTITISGRSSTTISFAWNTSGFAKGNYTISAYAIPIPGETDTADNTRQGGWVIIAMRGDISGPNGWPDGIVDIDDVVPIAIAYASRMGEPRYKPNCDITDDGIIDIDDLIIIAINYGKTYN